MPNTLKIFDDNALYTWEEAVAPVQAVPKKQTYFSWVKRGQFPARDVPISKRTVRYSGRLLNTFYSDPDAWRASREAAA